mmetsp:Transcript_48221/g.76229  ORF Transcript_48221/g.76229 Transcript_48221/m.76229 type:complete len:168 (+) Transcript_48221:122-625(+)
MTKRKPGCDTDIQNSESLLEEFRLPASTMLYRNHIDQPAVLKEGLEENEELIMSPEKFGLRSDQPLDFFLHSCDILDTSDQILQVRPKVAVQLLKVVSQNGVDISSDRGKAFLSEAEARSLDGLLVLESSLVVLLRPAEQVTIVDDDKKEGLSQQLLTDMFTRMSFR